MSKETHPNINAAALVVDLFTIINKHSRGKAKTAGRAEIVQAVANLVNNFAVNVSIRLDERFGGINGNNTTSGNSEV